MSLYLYRHTVGRIVTGLCIALLWSGCSTVRHIKKETHTFGQQLDTMHIVPEMGDTLNRSPHGNWQLRLSGSPFALGYKRGLLTEDLYQQQEHIFFEQVASFVPRPSRQRLLLNFLKWYHRRIVKDIPQAYREELFALAQFASDRYDRLGSGYERNLLLHGAHDIGHAMQDLMLVGCSSVALWDTYTPDGDLLIGRNFDFYVNEDFAANKIVEFIRPEQGYNYASVSWPGMIGVVSGMNEQGLTVTLNAGKSTIPLRGRTPISIVAREILEKAQNIDEAIAVARGFQVFISESILVGSDQDNRAVNIEVSPKKFDVYEVDNGRLLCTNHFQSPAYAADSRSRKHIETSHSQYRLDKLSELTDSQKAYTAPDVLAILRDVSGLDEENIGLGNEKSLNQLQAHHAVIFKPRERLMWVSNNPYQLGTFDGYDLNLIFDEKRPLGAVSRLELPADTMLKRTVFQQYLTFREMKPRMREAIRHKEPLDDEQLAAFVAANPNLWLTHSLLGNYYKTQKDWTNAAKYYEMALSKEISSAKDRKQIKKELRKIKKRL